MNEAPSELIRKEAHQSTQLTTPLNGARVMALSVVATALVTWASAPAALVAGIVFAFLIGHPFAHWNHSVIKWLLQISVVLLGFGMTLPAVLRLGFDGSLFAATTIGTTLLLGRWLGRLLALDYKTSLLVSAGTAICGGSAIAAVSSVIGASEAEIAVSLGTIFILNAAALYAFPIVGHLMHLNQAQFGLWAGVGIHDISSVVGAGLSYGSESLQTAVAVKLSRTLWIMPLTLALAFRQKTREEASVGFIPKRSTFKTPVPWFISLFLAASLSSSYVRDIAVWAPQLSNVAHRGTILALFLIGTSLSVRSLRVVGWRTVTTGLALWLVVSCGSLAAITLLKFEP